MSDYTYIKPTRQDGKACFIHGIAKHLILSLPFLGAAYEDITLHLQLRWSSDNVATPLEAVNSLDTGASDEDALNVQLFTGNTWISMPEHGFPQEYQGCRVLVKTINIDPEAYLYYSWYYVQDGVTIHVTPWVSTTLTSTSGVPKHSELQDRLSADQHPISAITGLSEALSKDYHEVSAHTDAEMADIFVTAGKMITFVGYSNGTISGSVVMRYKTSEGVFGTLTPGISAVLDNDNLTLGDSGAVVPPDLSIVVNVNSGTLEFAGIEVAVDTETNTLDLSSNAVGVENHSLDMGNTSENNTEPSLAELDI